MRLYIFNLLLAFVMIANLGFSQSIQIYDELTIGIIKGTLWSSPDFKSEVIGEIETGDTILVYEFYKYPFLMVKHDSLVGYLSEACIEESHKIDDLKTKLIEEEKSFIVTKTIASPKKRKKKKSIIRLRPDSNPNETLKLIPYSTELSVIDYENEYWKVRYQGQTGYVSNSFIVETKEMLYFKTKKSNRETSSFKNKNSNNKRTNRQNSYQKKTASQCSSYTKKGDRCQNRTKSVSGRCHIHD